jgi:proteasome lid subunit RPN8/RPN11
MKINEHSKELMIKDAEDKYPYECCGFVFGPSDEEIKEVMIIDNKRSENKERRFLMHPNDYVKAENYADENDTKLVGIYHSHPDHPNEPSDFDKQNALPNLSYLILTVRKGQFEDMRSWRMNEERNFLEEVIQ